MRIDLGFGGLDPDERSKFVMKVVGALGLPMMSLDLGLSWSPGPVRVDGKPYANPSKISCFNLILQILV